MSVVKSTYDFSSGDNLMRERKKALFPPLHNIHGRRYCESCKTYKPKGKRPGVKGWQCDECRKVPA